MSNSMRRSIMTQFQATTKNKTNYTIAFLIVIGVTFVITVIGIEIALHL